MKIAVKTKKRRVAALLGGAVLATSLATALAGFPALRVQAQSPAQPPTTPASPNVAEKPTPIDRKDLPKKAPCVVCTARGTMRGDLPVAAGVTYRGKPYYFCNKAEVEDFVKAPESFLPKPIPRPAPPLLLPRLEPSGAAGQPMGLADLKATRVVLVDFWATWCGPCVDAMPGLQRLRDRYAARGFEVVGVATDQEGAGKVGPFVAKRFKGRVVYPILLDTGGEKGVWKGWGVVGLPAMFLVKDGQVIGQWAGRIDLRDVERDVDKALGPS